MEIRPLQAGVSELSSRSGVTQTEKRVQSAQERQEVEITEKSISQELIKSINELENFFNEILQKTNEDRPFLDLERLNRILLSINKNLKIELDEKLNIPIYKIIDATTNEVLKQIPLEEILRFKRALFEFLANYLKRELGLSGVLLNREV